MLNPLDLTGYNVLVTGASSGIGTETATLLSQLGARIILVGRNPDRLQRALSHFEGEGHHIEVFDLATVDEIPRLLKTLSDKTGPLNGLVHSAGFRETIPLRLLSASQFENVFRINASVAAGLIKGFRQKGVRGEKASVVLMASVAGLVGQPGIAAYSASKGAVISLTKSLALELAPEGVRVNCIAPAMVDTEMTESIRRSVTPEKFAAIQAMHPLGLGTPRDIAHAVAFLLAPTGRWITGTTLVVDGGYTAH